MEAILVAKNLSIGHLNGKKTAKNLYSNLNFEIKRGEVTTIMGANGAGKSTLIKTICGIIPPLEGNIQIAGKDIRNISQNDMSQHISIVLTERIADGGITGYDVVSLGRYHYTGFFGGHSKKDIEIINNSIESIGISHLKDIPIANMSDGERQKIMIAKSLCQESDIIILDEPTAFLDIRSRIETMQLLRKCAKNENRAILVSSHDMEQSIQYSDNLWAMAKGVGLFCDTTEESIFSGNIEKVIGKGSNLHMDYNSGFFTPNVNCETKTVSISGRYQFLVKNTLRRENIATDENSSIKIEIKSHNEMIITENGTTNTATSIKELINYIK